MKQRDDHVSLITYEQEHLFLAFCSYVTLMHAKKLNLANVFLLVLQNKALRDLFKLYCDANSDYAVVQAFLSFDPSLHKSKYVMKYLNNSKNKITI
jgi:hypothetical protein